VSVPAEIASPARCRRGARRRTSLAVGTSLAYAARLDFYSWYYSATVTAQNYGVSPFPVSLTVVGQKYATTKIITKLKDRPNPYDVPRKRRLDPGARHNPGALRLPNDKRNGFLEAPFSTPTRAGPRRGSIRTNRDSEITIPNGQQFETRGVRFKRRQPGRDEHHHQGDVTGTTAAPAADGTSTCNIGPIEPHAQTEIALAPEAQAIAIKARSLSLSWCRAPIVASGYERRAAH